MNNETLRNMAQAALENWLFDEDTDPDGDVNRGLEYLASDGDFDEDVIEAHVTREDDWDGLQEWAKFTGEIMFLRPRH